MKHENGLTKKNRGKITTVNESLAIAAFGCHADAANGREDERLLYSRVKRTVRTVNFFNRIPISCQLVMHNRSGI